MIITTLWNLKIKKNNITTYCCRASVYQTLSLNSRRNAYLSITIHLYNTSKSVTRLHAILISKVTLQFDDSGAIKH